MTKCSNERAPIPHRGEEAGAPEDLEIEVTPEMIEAGERAFSRNTPLWDIDGEYLPDAMVAVYRAMFKARP